MSFQLTKLAYLKKQQQQQVFDYKICLKIIQVKKISNLISVNESIEKVCKGVRGKVIERGERVKNRLHHLNPVDDWNALISEEILPPERDHLVLLVSPRFVIAVVRRIVGF